MFPVLSLGNDVFCLVSILSVVRRSGQQVTIRENWLTPYHTSGNIETAKTKVCIRCLGLCFLWYYFHPI